MKETGKLSAAELADECMRAAENISPSGEYWVSKLLLRVAAALAEQPVATGYSCRNYPGVVCPSIECQFECQEGVLAEQPHSERKK